MRHGFIREGDVPWNCGRMTARAAWASRSAKAAFQALCAELIAQGSQYLLRTARDLSAQCTQST